MQNADTHMHPIIRILCLLSLAALAPWLPAAALLAAAASLLAWGFVLPASGQAMLRNIRRIRWLMLSLAVLYLWFTPGMPLLPALGVLSPTDVGLRLALHRAAVLVVMVGAAAGFLADVPPRVLTAALRQLLSWPVRTDVAARFANRAGLLLAELPVVEQRLRTSLKREDRDFADRAALLFEGIETDALRPVEPETVPSLDPVPHMQWLLPPALLSTGLLLVFTFPGA